VPAPLRALPTSALLALVLLPQLLAGGIMVGLTAERDEQLRRRPGQVQADAVGAGVRATLQEWSRLVQLGAANPRMSRALGEPRPADVPAMTSTLTALNAQVSAGKGSAMAFDTAGRIRALVPGGSPLAIGTPLDEHGSPAFGPALARPKTAHQSVPYVSPHTGRWVIATSVAVRDGARTAGVLAVETDLTALRARLVTATPRGLRARIVDARTHTLVADTAGDVASPEPNRARLTQWLPRAPRLPASGEEQVHTADVVAPSGNQNAWRVELLAPVPAGLAASLAPALLASMVTTTVIAVLLAGRRRPAAAVGVPALPAQRAPSAPPHRDQADHREQTDQTERAQPAETT
jgi:hypothetical protein